MESERSSVSSVSGSLLSATATASSSVCGLDIMDLETKEASDLLSKLPDELLEYMWGFLRHPVYLGRLCLTRRLAAVFGNNQRLWKVAYLDRFGKIAAGQGSLHFALPAVCATDPDVCQNRQHFRSEGLRFLKTRKYHNFKEQFALRDYKETTNQENVKQTKKKLMIAQIEYKKYALAAARMRYWQMLRDIYSKKVDRIRAAPELYSWALNTVKQRRAQHSEAHRRRVWASLKAKYVRKR